MAIITQSSTTYVLNECKRIFIYFRFSYTMCSSFLCFSANSSSFLTIFSIYSHCISEFVLNLSLSTMYLHDSPAFPLTWGSKDQPISPQALLHTSEDHEENWFCSPPGMAGCKSSVLEFIIFSSHFGGC